MAHQPLFPDNFNPIHNFTELIGNLHTLKHPINGTYPTSATVSLEPYLYFSIVQTIPELLNLTDQDFLEIPEYASRYEAELNQEYPVGDTFSPILDERRDKVNSFLSLILQYCNDIRDLYNTGNYTVQNIEVLEQQFQKNIETIGLFISYNDLEGEKRIDPTDICYLPHMYIADIYEDLMESYDFKLLVSRLKGLKNGRRAIQVEVAFYLQEMRDLGLRTFLTRKVTEKIMTSDISVDM